MPDLSDAVIDDPPEAVVRHRLRTAARHEQVLLRFAGRGNGRQGIGPAVESVALLRPLANRHPAAMARALAVKAACLHLAGRDDEVAAQVAESLEYCGRADASASAADLCRTSELIFNAGHREQALALIERVVNAGRVQPGRQLAAALAEYGRQLVVAGRSDEAVAPLREVLRLPANGRSFFIANLLLIDALGKTARYDELRKQMAFVRVLHMLVVLGPRYRRLYLIALVSLHRAWTEAGDTERAARTNVAVQRQRRIFRRMSARWRWLLRPFAKLLWPDGLPARRVPPPTGDSGS